MEIVEFLRARLDEDGKALAGADCTCRDGSPQRPDCPGRMFREVEAKRRIVDIHTDSHECTSAEDNCVWIDGEPGNYCETVRLLALPYADHPDYQSEWKP